jgi:tripartite-type tricarboxylate transporter receptor subunit TctC
MLRSLVALLLAGLASSAVAQDNYPSRQNTLIAPFAAGGSTDWSPAWYQKACGRNSVSQ